MDQNHLESDLQYITSLFHDEAYLQSLATSALRSGTAVRIRLFPFLLHSQRAIESAVLDCSNIALLRLYRRWRTLPDKQSWKTKCREFSVMQFSKEAKVAGANGYGKCKLRRLREALMPLRELIPDYIVSEAEFCANPFSLFKCTCLSSDNVWIQPAVASPSAPEPRAARRALGTKRPAEAVVHKLELVKCCVLAYIQELTTRPLLHVESSMVLHTNLQLPWLHCTALAVFEGVVGCSTWDLLRTLDRRIRLRLEAWDLTLFADIQLKAKAVHAAIEETMTAEWSDGGRRTEALSLLSPEKVVLVFLMQQDMRETMEKRSLPWGVALVAM